MDITLALLLFSLIKTICKTFHAREHFADEQDVPVLKDPFTEKK